MNKVLGFIISILFISSTVSAAEVSVTRAGRSDLNPLQRSAHVFGRGALNAVTSPWELVRTFKIERENYPRFWPVTYIPRAFYHFFVRVPSAGYDMTIFPLFVVPFTDDIRPFTRVYDLPDYAFQDELEEY